MQYYTIIVTDKIGFYTIVYITDHIVSNINDNVVVYTSSGPPLTGRSDLNDDRSHIELVSMNFQCIGLNAKISTIWSFFKDTV